MRRLPLPFALAALLTAAAGCSTPCQELANELCRCVGTGTTRQTCEQQAKDQLSKLDPTQHVQDICEQKLKTCKAPSNADFCEWVTTEPGHLACGLSYDENGQPQ